MKKEFRAHPLMLVSLIKPFLFVLVLPVLKGVIQYIIKRRVTGVLTLELIGFMAITLIGALRCRSFRLICGKNGVTIKMGVLFKSSAFISVNKLSSVQTVQNPIDAVFRAVSYRINTEAGPKGKADFDFKLSTKDSATHSAPDASMRAFHLRRVLTSAAKITHSATTTARAIHSVRGVSANFLNMRNASFFSRIIKPARFTHAGNGAEAMHLCFSASLR